MAFLGRDGAVMSDPAGVRTHPLTWVLCRKGHCQHTLGEALGIEVGRVAETDALVNSMMDAKASLREIVTTLSEREMTDGEFATALYALGWFDRGLRG
jgi:hypothetical protein